MSSEIPYIADPKGGDHGTYFWEFYSPETGNILICVPAEVFGSPVFVNGNWVMELVITAATIAARPAPYAGRPYPFAGPPAGGNQFVSGVGLSPGNANPGPPGTFWNSAA